MTDISSKQFCTVTESGSGAKNFTFRSSDAEIADFFGVKMF